MPEDKNFTPNVLFGVINVIQAQYRDICESLYDIKVKCNEMLSFQDWQREMYSKSPAYPTLIREGLI